MFGNQLSLGITIALRDAFSRPAGQITRGFHSLDDAAYRSARGIKRSLGNIEVGYANVTRTLAAAAAVGTMLAVPIKLASQFARQVAEIGTIADRTSMDVGQLRSQLLDLSDLGQDAFKSADAAYEAVSSGFTKTADAMTVTSEAAKSGVATLTDTATALSGLVSVLNAYRIGASGAAKVSDMFFETIKLGRVRGPEFAQTIGMFAPIASGAGMPLEQMLGTYSAMTLSGLSPSQAAQYSRQIVMGMQKPSAQSAGIAKRLGLDWGAAGIDRHHGDVAGMIMEAWKRTGSGKDKESFFKLFGGKQSSTGLMALLAKDNGALWMQHIAAHKNTQDYDQFGMPMSTRDRAVQEMMATTSQQAKVLAENIKAVGIEFGDAAQGHMFPFVKLLASGVSGIRGLLHNVPALSKAVYALGSAFTFALTAFAAMQLWMIRTNPRVRDLLASLNVFSRRIGLVTLNSRNVIPSFMGLATTIGLVTWGLRALYNQGGKFHDWVNQKVMLVKALSYALTHMSGIFADIPEEMAQALEKAGIFDQYIYWIRILGRVKLFFHGLFQGIEAGFSGQLRTLRNFGRTLANVFERAGLKKAADSVRHFMTGLKIEESQVRSWIQVGFTVGKVVAALITIYSVTKMWRGAVLLVQGAAWLLTRPFVMLKRIIWDGPVAALRAMFGLLGRMGARGSAGFSALMTPGGAMGPLTPGAMRVSNAKQALSHAYLAAKMNGYSAFSRAGSYIANSNFAAQMRFAQMRADIGQYGWRALPGMATLRKIGAPISRFGTYITREPASFGALGRGASNAAFGARMRMSMMPQAIGGAVTAGFSKMKSAGSSAFGALKSGVMGFANGLKAVSLFLVTNPIGLGILAVVAAVTLLIFKWDAVKRGIMAASEWFTHFLTHLPLLGGVFKKIFDGIAKGWQVIKTGFQTYVQPVLDKLVHAFQWVTDLLGITSNSYNNNVKNPLAGNQSLVRTNATGGATYQSAAAEYARLNTWVESNKAAFQAGNFNQDNERLFKTVYVVAKQLNAALPHIAQQNGMATAMLNNPALAALSDAGLARLKQVGDDWSQESADAAAERGGGSPMADAIPPMAHAIEAGARQGTAKGIQDALSRPAWSGDKWLQGGMSPFAGVEARYLNRSSGRRAQPLTSENMSTEMADLRTTVDRVTDAVTTLATKQGVVNLYLDGRKMASGLLQHFGKAMHREAARGVGGQE